MNGAGSYPDIVVAFVTPKSVVFGISRMFNFLVESFMPWDMQTFKERGKAERWISERCRERFGLEETRCCWR